MVKRTNYESAHHAVFLTWLLPAIYVENFHQHRIMNQGCLHINSL